MQEAEDLLPTEISKWLLEQLRLFRLSSGHGALEIHIQDGHILTYEDKRKHKASGRSRIRTRQNDKE